MSNEQKRQVKRLRAGHRSQEVHCYLNTPPEVHCHDGRQSGRFFNQSGRLRRTSRNFQKLPETCRECLSSIFAKLREHPVSSRTFSNGCSRIFRNVPPTCMWSPAVPLRAVTIHLAPAVCPSTNSIGLCLTAPSFGRGSFDVESSIFPQDLFKSPGCLETEGKVPIRGLGLDRLVESTARA